MKTSKITILAIIVTILVMVVPASAYISSQNIETKAERMVEIADQAQQTIMDVVTPVAENTTAMQMIVDAGLEESFWGNISLCVEAGTTVGTTDFTESGEGWTYLQLANQSLLDEEYEDAIDNAREALAIFRDALRSINDILIDTGIETTETVDTEILQEAIDRATDRIEELRDLIADEDLRGNLTDAEDFLTLAQDALDAGEIEDTKDALREANAIISYVCRELRSIAQELNPGRMGNFLDKAYGYRERFRERLGNAWEENIDVDEFLKGLGYDDEDDFMARFQEMISNAQDTEDVKDAINELKDIGKTIKEMDTALKQEIAHHKGQGQSQNSPGNGNGYGNMGGGKSP